MKYNQNYRLKINALKRKRAQMLSMRNDHTIVQTSMDNQNDFYKNKCQHNEECLTDDSKRKSEMENLVKRAYKANMVKDSIEVLIQIINKKDKEIQNITQEKDKQISELKLQLENMQKDGKHDKKQNEN